jgi:hypothetical protein
MDLPNALIQLARDTDLVAVRPRGVAIAMTPGQVIIKLGKANPHRWVPFWGDLIANDWFVGTMPQVQKQFAAMQAAQGE